MSIPTNEVPPQLRRVIKDTRKTYTGAAKWMVTHHEALLGERCDGFIELMDDLHRGLLVKIYATVVRADGQWTRMEKLVGAIMIEHLWPADLSGDQMRDAVEQILVQAEQLAWPSLVRPFAEYPPLRDWHSRLETCVIRLANLIAKCDGFATPEEADALQQIQSEVLQALLLKPTPGAEVGKSFHDFTHPKDRPPRQWSNPSHPVRQYQKSSPSQLERPNRSAQSNPAHAMHESVASKEQILAASLAELDTLIGLDEVKQRVQSLANYLRLQNERKAANLPTMPINLHMTFVGNPGTGKTTVARIIGQILAAMDILETGQIVETDRSGLVAEFAGQTAIKTNNLIDSAIGGVLFIDEAYSLVDASGDDAYGREAIQTLLKRMEDERSRLVVILAGYPNEMDSMIRSNPGLSSRIGTRLPFADYLPDQLGRIFEFLCQQNQYVFGPQARLRMLIGLTLLHQNRDRHFGNGRLVRNCFEETVRSLANRVAQITPLTDALLTTFAPQDISLPGVSPAQIDDVVSQKLPLHTTCTHCDKKLIVPPELLGRTIKCSRCEQVLPSIWPQIDL